MTTIATLFLQPVITWSIIIFYYRYTQRDLVINVTTRSARS